MDKMAKDPLDMDPCSKEWIEEVFRPFVLPDFCEEEETNEST